MMAGGPDRAPAFEAVKTQLDPYVKDREETVRIRWLLTAFLASQFNKENENRTYFNLLSNPSDGQATDRPSKHTTGARRDYLKAVDAYRLARQEHIRLVGLEDYKEPTPSRVTAYKPTEAEGPLPVYLDLLKERKRYERLKILTDYNDLLSEKLPAKSDYLEMLDISDQPSQLLSSHASEPLNTLEHSGLCPSSLQVLSAGIEKAALCAKHNLLAERRMLQNIDSGLPKGEPIRRFHSTLHGLIRIRDELVGWVENELSHAAALSSQETPTEDGASKQLRNTENSLESIQNMYKRYIQARKSLLNARSSTLSVSESTVLDVELFENDGAPKRELNLTQDIINALEGVVLPVSHAQKSVILQKSHITTIIAKHQRSVLQSVQAQAKLSRLFSEHNSRKEGSHASGTVGMDSISLSQLKSRSGEEVVDLAIQWAVAAEKDRIQLQDLVTKDIQSGHESLQCAHQQFKELNGLEGHTIKDDNDTHHPEPNTDDIWTEDIQKPRNRNSNRNAQKARKLDREQSLGLWQQLNGRLGAIGDGV